ncbi:hypothetical protein GN330_02880 [Nitratireductor sp. CAU 1489]|uniref:Transmembrane protein n=1 Tax=Nitratireductor arenosus TaxID=2682096 RepID=A0A844QDK8_9HYPH|nr:hypothetical protein [Nitratireductor arenosus]MVA96193.1 hypothetical protein [Nitratireductor arenosus]
MDTASLLSGTGLSAVRLALLFGAGAVMLGLIVAPLAEKRFSGGVVTADSFYGVDMTSTGSIRSGRTYTVRKSVLQTVPGAACIISGDGRQIGDC